MDEVAIHTEYIKLQQFLKLAGFIGQGSDVKVLLAEGRVTVNGIPATERGKKVHPNDIVEVAGMGTAACVLEVE